MLFLAQSMERLLKQPWRREPAGRRIREWPAPPGRSPAEDSGAGPPRGPALRHQQAAEGFPRMRLQDLGKVSLSFISIQCSHRLTMLSEFLKC
ncbi:uncharacterized protein TNIN_492621 [Trichonephila inaurata madagascariensis]|uniref:Uncharacterized protein n=1 Tax=Trichonephila inaurata madagascariensis TaxID=2747483 RepID=A0A8X6WLR9_9ARAC|nr:uncharacterized protein TNIN_492621 [Trichonephila inaurata madagascariensis]